MSGARLLSRGVTLLLASTLLTAPTAHAQWDTSDVGLRAARRCHARNLMSTGSLLAFSSVAMLATREQKALGAVTLGTGIASLGAGIGLRVALRGGPTPEDAYERWPRRRCEARALAIRGGVYGAVVLVRTGLFLAHHLRHGTDRSTRIAALIGLLPLAVAGGILLGVGLYRVRRLGSRPPPSSASPLVSVPLGRGEVGFVARLSRRAHARAAGLSYTLTL